MAIYKEISSTDIKTQRNYLNQLIDVLQEDVSGSSTRRKYQTFVTGGVGPGVTSSLYQTIYDQDFTLQTANAICDITFGIQPGGLISQTSQNGVDSAGKELFPSSSLMMREKLDIYRQFAQSLLGNSTTAFTAPFDSSNASDNVDVALFIAFKRLFARDSIKRETTAIRFFQTASMTTDTVYNTNVTSPSGSAIYTDIGTATNKLVAFGGQVGNIVDSADTNRTVGLMFYDRGVMMLDLEKITSGSQFMSGTIDAMHPLGRIVLGSQGTETYNTAKFIPDFVVSASIDNVIDHIAGCRFGSGSQSSMTFQNTTNINSTLVFCRASADEFNYSSNPSYVDSDNRIVVIDAGQEDTQQSFSFITSVGLYDANDQLLMVAKTSRPIEKSSERDLTLCVRVDF
jgi:hypothetical protein